MYNNVTVGETVKFSVTVSNLNNKAEDPAGIMFKIKNPSGALTTFTYLTDLQLVKDGVGKYSIDQVLNVSGVWKLRWETAAPNISIREESITVDASVF